ncbi:MAG TPA: FAD-dependent oxidoreductase [Solirubrobacteraceae bacterium]|nr:FAD-dependent oxidoreductase [Solirubrobacteraceae bacterium]
MTDTFVIVGGGLAGAKAAETLREEGFAGRLVLIAAEDELPYERPPLSKGYLLGSAPREEAQVHPREFYGEHDIELLAGVAATAVDVVEHRLALADGRSVTYDRLLIATGAVPRRPPIPGIDLDGVHTLRTLADSDALRAAFQPGGSVAVIGAGWIGCEVAAAARTHGADVVLVERAATPLHAVLGPELGGWFGDLHAAHGVRVLTGVAVERIAGAGRVEAVRLGGGDTIECDAVVVGVGVAPDTTLAAAAGLQIDDGIVVDEHLRTSAPDVFAAGDVANAFHPYYGRHVRVEHWANALNQGPVAARSMLGRDEPYDRLPYFFTDQYDAGMEYTGLHDPHDTLILRGAPADAAFHALWLDAERRVTAGMHINQWDTIESVERLIRAGAPVDLERLADTDTELDALARAPS